MRFEGAGNDLPAPFYFTWRTIEIMADKQKAVGNMRRLAGALTCKRLPEVADQHCNRQGERLRQTQSRFRPSIKEPLNFFNQHQ
jgi:hypothetical protein